MHTASSVPWYPVDGVERPAPVVAKDAGWWRPSDLQICAMAECVYAVLMLIVGGLCIKWPVTWWAASAAFGIAGLALGMAILLWVLAADEQAAATPPSPEAEATAAKPETRWTYANDVGVMLFVEKRSDVPLKFRGVAREIPAG